MYSGLDCVGHTDNVLVLPSLEAYKNSESLMLLLMAFSFVNQGLKKLFCS